MSEFVSVINGRDELWRQENRPYRLESGPAFGERPTIGVMHRLAYRSTRARSLSDDQVVDGIVLPTMEKNRRLNITGCLWCGRSSFFQILEGEREVVQSLYATIQGDARHHGVELIEEREIAEREFPRFAMKLIRGDEGDAIGALIRQFGGVTEDQVNKPTGDAGVLQKLVSLLIAGRGSA